MFPDVYVPAKNKKISKWWSGNGGLRARGRGGLCEEKNNVLYWWQISAAVKRMSERVVKSFLFHLSTLVSEQNDIFDIVVYK